MLQVRDFIGLVRELSFNEIRSEASTPPRIIVLASTETQATAWRSSLFGDVDPSLIELGHINGAADLDPFHYDAIVIAGVLAPETSRRWINLFSSADEPSRIVEFDPLRHGDEQGLERIRRRITDESGLRALAMGRYIPGIRHAAAAEVIADTSRVNAQFAAVSNIPALVPVIGNIISAGADFLVLTKNQLMMLYKIAAIHEQDLNSQFRIYGEMVPVVGLGMVWRTAARQIAALLPVIIGAVPKVMIAYVGTYVIGQAASFYYQHGEKMSREQLDDVYRQAVTRWQNSTVRRRFGDAGGGEKLEELDSPPAKRPVSESTSSAVEKTDVSKWQRLRKRANFSRR